MTIAFSKKAEKTYRKLTPAIQRKTDRQFAFLLENYRHPSLRARKMQGSETYEGRIGIHYRFTFQVVEDQIYILTIGPHDEGLGKK